MNDSNLNSNRDSIRILIVDDRKLIGETLKIYLETEPDMEIIGYANNATTGLEKIEQLNPEIVILDLEMPDMNGISVIGIVSEHFPATKVLVLSGHEEPEYINQAVKQGAKGYLLKGTASEDLADAIRYVNRGYFHLGPGLLEKLTLSSLDKSATKAENSLEQKLEKPLQELRWELTEKCKDLIDQSTEDTRQQFIDMMDMKLYALKSRQTESILHSKRLQSKVDLLSIGQILLALFVVGYMMIDRVL